MTRDSKTISLSTISTGQMVPENQEFDSMYKKRIIKNLVVIGVAFLFMFCAFQALGNLQSTLNSEQSLGTASQSVIYATLLLSSFFLPTLVIDKLGLKKALAICLLAYCPYIAANLYPQWWTMIPAAILLGLGAAPMWSAKCTYLNEIGFRYAKLTGPPDASPSEQELFLNSIIARFFGIFFAFFQSSQIWGNLISFLVLDEPAEANLTGESHCGVDFDFTAVAEAVNGTMIKRPDDAKVYTLIGIYLGLGIAAGLLILLFLDPLDKVTDRSSSEQQKTTLTSGQLVLATFRHLLKHRAQVILIPLTIYSGLEQSFFLSEYTKAFVACSWGISKIGFVAIAFGVFNAIVSPSSGHLIQLFGRKAVFLMAALTNLAVCIVWLVWIPDPDDSKVYLFVLAGVWGIGDAVWQTQINALYGVLFKGEDEPAYANYRLWESLGFVMAFAYSGFLNIVPKLSILMTFLVLGMAGYLYVELKIVPKKESDSPKVAT